MKADGIPFQPDPSCLLCSHPQRIVGASMRDLNATMEEIAVALHLDPVAVERHFSICVPRIALPSLDDLDSAFDASDQQLELLLQHSLELFHSAALTGNMVAGSSALAVRLRCLTEIGRRTESRAERQELLLGADPTDPHTWPEPVSRFINLYIDGVLSRVAESSQKENEVLPT